MSDPYPALESACKKLPEARRLEAIYEKCGERLAAHGGHAEHSCSGYYFDWGNEVQKCVIPKLFAKLK